LHGITKQLVTYKRADGVPLSFTLYLPANHKQGERLPIVWAYPWSSMTPPRLDRFQVPLSLHHDTGISHCF